MSIVLYIRQPSLSWVVIKAAQIFSFGWYLSSSIELNVTVVLPGYLVLNSHHLHLWYIFCFTLFQSSLLAGISGFVALLSYHMHSFIQADKTRLTRWDFQMMMITSPFFKLSHSSCLSLWLCKLAFGVVGDWTHACKIFALCVIPTNHLVLRRQCQQQNNNKKVSLIIMEFSKK